MRNTKKVTHSFQKTTPGMTMSQEAKQEYFEEIYSRYQRADKEEKARILNEFCRVCSYNRKYAIRKLNKKSKPERPIRYKRKGRPRTYNNPVIIRFLKVLLRSTNLICSKRLKQIIPLWLPHYERMYCLRIPEFTRAKIIKISAASIDRIIGKERKRIKKLGLCTTRPGSLLKKYVPIKTNQWDESRVGFIEADTVAHCGSSLSGHFIYTVNSVDIATGWIESRAVWGKGQKSCFEAIADIEANLPFRIRGFDSDNGSEFLNWRLLEYFTGRSSPVEYTRSRAYQKNDNAHIEGKNWTHIRQYIGYKRLDNFEQVRLLNNLYSKYWSNFFNFFIPSGKLISKNRVGAKTIKVHDLPKTPYQRIMENKVVPMTVKKRLTGKLNVLNPFELEQEIKSLIIKILALS